MKFLENMEYSRPRKLNFVIRTISNFIWFLKMKDRKWENKDFKCSSLITYKNEVVDKDRANYIP